MELCNSLTPYNGQLHQIGVPSGQNKNPFLWAVSLDACLMSNIQSERSGFIHRKVAQLQMSFRTDVNSNQRQNDKVLRYVKLFGS